MFAHGIRDTLLYEMMNEKQGMGSEKEKMSAPGLPLATIIFRFSSLRIGWFRFFSFGNRCLQSKHTETASTPN